MYSNSRHFADVEVLSSEHLPKIENPVYTTKFLTISQDFCMISIPNVADYFVEQSKRIIVNPHKNADDKTIDLFLNGTVLGALLHQQDILPFHGSSVLFQNRGILFCGRSGSGKSSLTTRFYQEGAEFITDDITPVFVENKNVLIGTLKSNIKLWKDSVEDLGVEHLKGGEIRDSIEKYYIDIEPSEKAKVSLDTILILNRNNIQEFAKQDLKGIVKYNVLRNNIYRKIFLKGMPETNKSSFTKIIDIANRVNVVSVSIPFHAKINDTFSFIKSSVL